MFGFFYSVLVSKGYEDEEHEGISVGAQVPVCILPHYLVIPCSCTE